MSANRFPTVGGCALAVLCLAAAAGCTEPIEGDDDTTSGPDYPPVEADGVVLIVVDTLRGDRFGCADPVGIMPEAEGFFAGGACFAYAQSDADWTYPGVASLLAGVHDRSLGILGRDDPLPAGIPLLSDRLAALGFLTVLASGNNVAEAGGISGRYQRDYGAEPEDGGTLPSSLDADLVDRFDKFLTDHAIAPGRRFFVHLQFVAPHEEYCPPDGSADTLVETSAGVVDLCEWDAAQIQGALGADPEAMAEGALAAYDAEAAYTDRRFGEVVDLLAARDLLDSTLVVLVSDHGQAFGEHGHWAHSQGLTFDQVRVPLAFRGPGVPAGVAVDGVVSTVDVAPTVLGLLGHPAPDDLEGRDLGPLLGDPAGAWPGRAFSTAEGTASGDVLHAVTASAPDGGWWKLIRSSQAHQDRLYAVSEDPAETTDRLDDPAAADVLVFLDGMLDAPLLDWDDWSADYGQALPPR